MKSVVEMRGDEQKQFQLLADFGVIEAPTDYDHITCLARFREKYLKEFWYYAQSDIVDAKFPNPSRILKSGDRLHVRIYQQVNGDPTKTTPGERMAFLAREKQDVYVGAQGVTLVYEQKKADFLPGYFYVSYDKKENLWEGYSRCGELPCLYIGGTVNEFTLEKFMWKRGAGYLFFGFSNAE